MFPVGIDVSKNTLDLCMLYDGIKGRIKTRNIQNNRHSVENMIGERHHLDSKRNFKKFIRIERNLNIMLFNFSISIFI